MIESNRDRKQSLSRLSTSIPRYTGFSFMNMANSMFLELMMKEAILQNSTAELFDNLALR
jgi:hypothetical protein